MGEAGEARLKTKSSGPSTESPSTMSCLRNSNPGRPRSVLRFCSAPVRKLSTATTAAPSSSSRSHRWEPTKPAPPSTAARFPRMAVTGASLGQLVERRLAGQLSLVLVEHQIDPLPDVLGHGHLGLLVQRLEALVLLGGDVDGGADLLSGHGDM